MMSKLGMILIFIGVLSILVGTAIASFKVNWIFGIVVLGFILLVIGCFFADYDDDDYFYDD